MSGLILSMFLIGAVLGMRFKVFILIPAIGLASTAILVGGIARNHNVSAVLIASVLASISLQIGYVCVIITRFGIALAGTRRPHKTALHA